MRPIVSLLLLLMLCSQSIGQNRVDDSAKYQIWIGGDANSTPATWFSTNPDLAALKAKVHFQVIGQNSKLFTDRYGKILGESVPVLLFQRGDGGVVYMATKLELSRMTASQLYSALRDAYIKAQKAVPSPVPVSQEQSPLDYPNADCPDGNCPQPSPYAPRPPRIDPQLQPLQPFLSIPDRIDETRSFLSGAINQVIWLIGCIIALGVILIFAILGLAVVYFVVKLIS